MVLGEVAVAATIVEPRLARLLLPILAVAGVALVFRYPFAASCALLVLVDSIFHTAFFPSPPLPLSVRLYEVVLVVLLLVAVVRPSRRTLGGLPGWALLAFMAVLGISLALAVTAGRTGFSSGLAWARPFFMLAFFFVVARLFPAERARQLLTVAAAIGALTGVIAFMASVNPSVGELLQDPTQQFVREREGIGMLERVRLPGVALAYLLVWLPVVRIVESRGLVRLGWIAVLAGMALNIAVSLNRNMWVGLGVGIVLLVVLGGRRVRHRLLLALTVGALGLAAMLSLGDEVDRRSSIEPVIERGRTLLDPEAVVRERSLSARVSETERAWEVILDRPLTGVGPGAEFGVFFEENRSEDTEARVPQLFLHNQYLYLLLIGGIPALAVFGVFLMGVLREAWRSGRDAEQTALGVGVAMVMVSALVMIAFGNADFALALALVSGGVVALRHGRHPPGRATA